jgi:hypothetical protein
MPWRRCSFLIACSLSLTAAIGAEETSPSAIVTDVDGKEVKVADVRFTAGTRRLAWLADPKGSTEDDRKGPLALELREPHSTTFTKGVLTLVPVSSLESARYDYERQLVTLGIKGVDEPLTGTLQFKGINVLGFGGMVDGKPAAFSAGVLGKNTVKSVSFPAAKALPKPSTTGTKWSIQIVQPLAKDPVLNVRNLKVLYQFPGGIERVEDGIPVRKGPLLPLNGTVKRFELLATDPNTNIAAAEVETTTGPERVIAIPLTQTLDTRTGHLVGFLGEVDAGWKLFPLHTIKVMTLTDVKKKVE